MVSYLYRFYASFALLLFYWTTFSLEGEEIRIGEEVRSFGSVAIVKGGDVGHDQGGCTCGFVTLWGEYTEAVGFCKVCKKCPVIDTIAGGFQMEV